MAEDGDPWIRRRTAPMRFAPQNKNKVTLSLPVAVAEKEDKIKLMGQRSSRHTRSTASPTTKSPFLSTLDSKCTKKGIGSPKTKAKSPIMPTLDLASRMEASSTWSSPPTLDLASESSESQEIEEFPIKVLQTPISMFEFKSTTKFNVLHSLSMGLAKRALNVYGEPCVPPGVQDGFLEVLKIVKEPEPPKTKGPAGSEYGQEERAAAKKLRFKLRRKSTKNNPTMDMVKEEISLKIQDEMAHYHKMKGIPRKMNDIQGSYYALIPDSEGSGELHAYPVKDWCSFDHLNKTKPLTEEEAEETFLKRDKILNLFTVMVVKRMKGVGEDEEEDDCVLVKDTHAGAKKKPRLEDSQNSDPDVEIMENGDSDDSDY